MRRTASDKKEKALTCAKDCWQVVAFVVGLCVFIAVVGGLFLFRYMWWLVNDDG